MPQQASIRKNRKQNEKNKTAATAAAAAAAAAPVEEASQENSIVANKKDFELFFSRCERIFFQISVE